MSLEKFWKSRQQIKEEGRAEIANRHEDAVEGENSSHEPKAAENIPEGLLPTEAFLEMYGEDAVYEIYTWYENAITRRDREPLEYDRFRGHFFEGWSHDSTYMYGDLAHGYVFGFFEHGAFLPTHFAPKNIRKGYELVK